MKRCKECGYYYVELDNGLDFHKIYLKVVGTAIDDKDTALLKLSMGINEPYHYIVSAIRTIIGKKDNSMRQCCNSRFKTPLSGYFNDRTSVRNISKSEFLNKLYELSTIINSDSINDMIEEEKMGDGLSSL